MIATPNGDVLLFGERSSVMQLLVNLVRNAVEALDDGTTGDPPRIEVIATTGADGTAQIEVRDNGMGFDAQAGARMLERGFSTKQRGSGEGLTVVDRIVQRMEGVLQITSPGAGHGTVARVTLPKP